MTAEGDSWWIVAWRKLTTIRQGVGVVGQVISLAVVTVLVLGLALRLVTDDPWLNVPLLIGMGLIFWLARDVARESFQFGRDRPEYAALKSEHSVQVIKAQGSREKPVMQIEGTGNVVRPGSAIEVAPPKAEDKTGEAAQ